MTMYVFYIGDVRSEGFDWDGDPNGNWPPVAGSTYQGDARSHGRFMARIHDGRWEARQADWGCWVAFATREQIIEFFAGNPDLSREAEDHVPPEVRNLSCEDLHAFVTMED